MLVTTMVSIFGLCGYLAIIFEKKLKADKASLSLLTANLCWMTFLILGGGELSERVSHLEASLGYTSQVLFFLIGALTIVEVIDAHNGFQFLTNRIKFKSPTVFFWILLFASFFLSSLIDNLTTCIVMITLLKKIVPVRMDRLLFSGAVIFAVNAGGAWTPIGDVTTTMLWIADKISTDFIIQQLFVPSFISLIIFGVLLMVLNRSVLKNREILSGQMEKPLIHPGAKRVLWIGLASILSVPVLKSLFEYPPFMGMLLGVSVIWLVTDRIHGEFHEKRHLKVFHALGRIDMSTVMFFLGILLAVDALQAAGAIEALSNFLEQNFSSQLGIVYGIGIVSAIVDNVPLVSAMIKMYDPVAYPINDMIWPLAAYAAGVGGSLLIIGSAPGIALMSAEKVDFMWYMKKFTLPVLVAYTVGYLLILF